jgi:hypothetical protein
MRIRIALAMLLPFLPLAAQWPGPDTLGAQVRLSLPGGNLPDATGSRAPGYGASLMAEMHFESTVCARAELGMDNWAQKGGSGDRSVRAYHLGVEALCFLQDSGDYLKGPYLAAGAGVYTWALGADTRATGKPLRSAKAALTAGFGYRFNAHLDAELKILAGKIDADFTGNATLIGITWRF